jgi:hypothetical protein
MAPVPKQIRVSDRGYLAWCRRQPCAFCPRPLGGEAHHTIKKGMGGATLRDDRAVPVCRRCHKRCHGETVVEKSGARMPPIQTWIQIRAAMSSYANYRRAKAAPTTPAVPF